MEIRILGTGCPRCKKLEQLVREAINETTAEVVITKVTDYQDIMRYPIASTPALVIDEVVKSSGRIPSKEEIIAWVKEEMAR